MRVLRADSYRRMPWKNGGGETIEIAVSPEGASLDSFDWRVSMARVERPGPFSLFPGVDRTLAVLDGAGIGLSVGGREELLLARESDPFSFPADVPVEATLPAGGITDLNVMSRRGRTSHRVRRIAIERSTTVVCEGDTTVLLLRGSDALLGSGGSELALSDGDSVIGGPDMRGVEIRPGAGAAMLYVIEFWT